ncbi:MAG: YkgJ family cysteine cluster protein [Proteobacteria bacterium]|nr:YkgJ family cysteine cluster protein [Pseudomonadota bacterium]
MRKIDLDRLSTWVAYKPSLCKGCMGYCCRLPVDATVDDLVRMKVISQDEALQSARKIARKLQKDGIIVSFRASKMLFQIAQKSNRDCIFLGDDRLCTIYDLRPDVCRRFPTCSPRPNFCPATPIEK